MKSSLFVGKVRHRRFTPVRNEFTYRLFMVYLDLAELDEVFRGRWLWSARRFAFAQFRRSDHVGDPKVPLHETIRELVFKHSGIRPNGPIRLLTHLRYYGYIFNPVSFYYCFDAADKNVETIVAEVNNTPWGQRHCYVLDAKLNEGSGPRKRYRFAKDFHVSPFLDLEYDYDWRFVDPASQLSIHMENLREGRPHFDATMVLKRQVITGASLARALLRFPFMTGTVIALIYWQALKLWWKRVPFHEHPRVQRPGVGTGNATPSS